MIGGAEANISIEMLRSAVAFRAIQTDSQSRTHPLLLLRYRRNDLDRTRYGLSTSRRVGSAVVRNRLRRRLRVVLERLDARVVPGWDVLFVARAAAGAADQAALELAVGTLMAGARLLRDP